jgi:hypothetical protein
MDDGYVMAVTGERLTQALHGNAIPPEVMRRVKRRKMAKSERSH